MERSLVKLDILRGNIKALITRGKNGASFGSKRYSLDRTVFLYVSGLQSAWRSSLRGVEGGDG